MGGVYPATDIFSEFNFNCGEFLLGDLAECEGSAKAAVENMPPSVKMVFSGFEAELDSPDLRTSLSLVEVQRGLSLIGREVHSVSTPALLCHIDIQLRHPNPFAWSLLFLMA